MEGHSIFDGAASSDPLLASTGKTEGDGRFSLGSAGSSSSVEGSSKAPRDLEAILLLLADRALYITGSSGSAIALREGRDLICRASVGASAPELGASLQAQVGFGAECIDSRRTVNCGDVNSNLRVDREKWKAQSVTSALAVPLLQDDAVLGMMELTASRANAYAPNDVIAIERIARLVVIALEDATAAVVPMDASAPPNPVPPSATGIGPEPVAKPEPMICSADTPVQQIVPLAATLNFSLLKKSIIPLPKEIADAVSPGPDPDPKPALAGGANVRRCAACGFPVSGSRLLCLDCEAAGIKADPGSMPFAQLVAERRKQSWLRTHMYTIGTVLVSAGTIALLILYLK